MPGNINAHGHYYSAFACGISIPGDAPISLPTILHKLWWPFDKALTAEDVRYSVWNGVIDAIKHGTTTMFDHHSSPNCIDGVLDLIAEVVEEAGLRSILCFEVTDRDGPERARAGIEENVRFAGLGFVVIDEQHRFGVVQRAGLKEKGSSPDVLVMTATPIPRTLAMTVYGDLDVSTLDGTADALNCLFQAELALEMGGKLPVSDRRE